MFGKGLAVGVVEEDEDGDYGAQTEDLVADLQRPAVVR